MKGLTLNYLDRKPEAYELVRAGLKNDLRSHVCWHVYGLLYRSDREYREAIKCYANALRLDKGNQQILRDMAWLQVQMRDRSGLVETRRQLLTQKPGVKANWLGFSVAAHLDGRHRLGVHILEAYEKTLTGEPPASEAYEHSEMILYKLQLLEEGGGAEDALALLQREDSRVVDRVGAREARVRLLNRLGRAAEALPDLEKLIDINPENTEYYAGLLDAHALPRRAADRSAAQEAALDALSARLAAVYPRCSAVQRTLLDWKEGEAFRLAADSYARRFIQGGIPSLFIDLKPLYTDDAKRAALESLMLGYLEALQAGGRLPPPPGGGAGLNGSEVGPPAPAALVWVQAYLAHHFAHLGQPERALGHVDAAIRHTPTALDLYLDKAHILASLGAAGAAAYLADHARRMDLADRYINCEAVKLMFRAGRAEEAETTAALFTKDGDQLNNLYDMQAMWYEIEYGRAYRRAGDLGKALKKFHAVFQHFEDIHEDQFDFHAYCLRKVTLGAYVAMLRMEDSLYEHRFYREAAWEAAGCYLALADDPPRTEEDERREEEAALAAMSAAERKKYRAKKRKEEARREKEAEDRARAEKEGEGGGDKKKGANAPKAENAAPKDADPDGRKLMRVADPLRESSKYLGMLEKCDEQFANTHLLAFEVALRRGLLLLALRAARKARDLAQRGGEGAGGPAEEARAHLAAVRLALRAASFKGHATVEALLKEGVAALLGGQRVREFNAAFLAGRGAENLECRVAAAEGLAALDAASGGAAAGAALLATPSGLAPAAAGLLEKASLDACVAAHRALMGPLAAQASTPECPNQAAATWVNACMARFPHSDQFPGVVPRGLSTPGSLEKLVTFANAFEQLEIV